MKVLVTGGAGFIGSNLVKELVAQGNSVTVLDNLMSGYRSNLDNIPNVEFVLGDVRDGALVDRLSKEKEIIFHLAASVGNKRSIDDPIQDAQINVLGTINILEGARKNGVRKVVVSSSAGIFGELKTLPIKEDHPLEPDSPYGSTKLCEEKISLAYGRLYGFEVVCLRYFNVYGPNQRFDAYGNVIPIFAFQMLRNESLTIFGDGEQTRDFINVRDVVQANIKSGMAKGVSGAFNLGSATRVTINHLVELLRQASGLQPEVTHGPLRKGDVRHSLADISAASSAFGFAATVDLSDGLNEYMRWAKTEAENPKTV
jgi:nucleoside-diphosphate-sugar epimerase